MYIPTYECIIWGKYSLYELYHDDMQIHTYVRTDSISPFMYVRVKNIIELFLGDSLCNRSTSASDH